MPPISCGRKAAISAPSTTKQKTPGSKDKEPAKSLEADDADTATIPPSQPQPSQVPSPLTIMLSQYAILEQLCHSLPSADLVHLAATSKENRHYITGSPVLHKKFRESCPCDGKGIGSRARYFGHWNGNPGNATVSCEEHEARTCARCTAKVCNACRFQFFYFDLRKSYMCEGCGKIHDSDGVDDQFVGELDDECDWLYLLAELFDCTKDIPDKIHPAYGIPLPSIKALHLLGKARERHFCATCRPNLLSAHRMHQWAEENAKFSDDDNYFDTPKPVWCHCGPFELEEKYPWLCIPCFIDLEVEALKSLHQHRRTVVYGSKQESGDGAASRKVVSSKVEYICDCGKPAVRDAIITCRWCNNLVRPDRYDADDQ